MLWFLLGELIGHYVLNDIKRIFKRSLGEWQAINYKQFQKRSQFRIY